MTPGQIMFLSGGALLAITIILAIVFMIKKPKYHPGDAVAEGNGQTAPLRNGYPTEPITARYKTEKSIHTDAAGQAEGTMLLSEVSGEETELLPAETELLPEETQLLIEEGK